VRRGAGAFVAAAVLVAIGPSCNALTSVDDVEFTGSSTAGTGAASGSVGSGGPGGAGLTGGSGSGGCAGVISDGVCCDIACDGLCLACTEAKTGLPDGTCAQVKAGTDPDGDCSAGEVCAAGVCHSCSDGVQNGDELGLDCGGATCGACAEDCTNGTDDNNDGLADCADPICAGYTCAPAPPAGWTGPALLYTGAGPVPACATGFPTSTFGGTGALDAPPATCGCSCSSPPTGASCGIPSVTLYDNDTCTGSNDIKTPASAGTCLQVATTDIWNSAVGAPVPVIGGACTPSNVVVTKPPTSFSDQALVCAGATPGLCADPSTVCVPKPGAPFGLTACVSHTADIPCEGSAYTQKHVLYAGVTDTRDCSACACGAATGISCTGVTHLFHGGSCLNLVADSNHDGSCEKSAASEIKSIKFEPTGGPTGGNCPQTGGQAVGGVTGSGATTVCCMP